MRGAGKAVETIAVKIYTLGRFAVERDGQCAALSGGAQRKPLALDVLLVPLYLASTYAHQGRNQKAQAALGNCQAGNRWSWPSDLRQVMLTPLGTAKPECADRFAEGLLKAGLPAKLGGYYKFFEENRLRAEEIRKPVSGRTLTGGEQWGDAWQIRCAENGEFTSGNERGKWWIEDEDDLLCIRWDERYENCAFCGTVFRNPDWTGGNDQYLKVNQASTSLFAVED